MKKLVLFLSGALFLSNAAAWGQVYPGAVANDQYLLVAKDLSDSSLSAAVDASTLSIPVLSGATFTAYEAITIDAEKLEICSVSGNTLNICAGTRGFGGTVAASHLIRAEVRGNNVQENANRTRMEVESIESTLGPNLANVSAGGVGSQTANLTFTGLVDGGCADQTFTFTGIGTSTKLSPGWPSALPAGVTGVMFPSASNTVDVRLCNHSGAAQTFGPLGYIAKIANYFLSGGSTFTWSAINDGACAVKTFTLTGAAAGSSIVAGWPAALESGLEGHMRASAANTIEIRLCNFSGGPVTPSGAETFAALVAE
jgi:hypothetical protein